jgi:hypothetical protein
MLVFSSALWPPICAYSVFLSQLTLPFEFFAFEKNSGWNAAECYLVLHRFETWNFGKKEKKKKRKRDRAEGIGPVLLNRQGQCCFQHKQCCSAAEPTGPVLLLQTGQASYGAIEQIWPFMLPTRPVLLSQQG